MPERRIDPRVSCFLRAAIVLENGERRIECEAHDISERGLRLAGADFRELPDSFILEVPRRSIEGRVDIVRRGPDFIGVVFKEPA